MKTTRLFLAAIALAIVSACSATDLTGPSATDTSASQQTTRSGTMGSGN
jgi:outer membrane biogenesis lipoprotein LolB